jgi:hypothetical protein
MEHELELHRLPEELELRRETMRALRRAELVCAALAGVVGLLTAAVPLFVPYSDATGTVIVDGQVVRTVHYSQTWFVDHLGVLNAAILLGSIALLSILIVLAAILHSPARTVIPLTVLWVVPVTFFALSVRYYLDIAILLEPAIILGLVCAIVASIRQFGFHQPAGA